MSPATLRALVQGAAIAGALVAILAQIRLAGGLSIGVVLFGPWAVLPFAIAYRGVRARPESFWRPVGLGCMNLFGLVMYLDLLLSSRLSSTSGLALLFVPLWQCIGCAVILALTSARKVPKEDAG